MTVSRRTFLAGAGLALPALLCGTGQAAAGASGSAIADPDPDAPLTIVVSLKAQRLRVYSGARLIGQSRVSTGKPGHETPAGIFSILDKRQYHTSNLYSDAPMPFMQRLTWSGIALHAGALPGYPASHGCIRMPYAFARNLFALRTRHRHVVVSDADPEPLEVTGEGLLAAAMKPPEMRVANADGDTAPAPGPSQAPLRLLLTRYTGARRLSDVQSRLNALGYDAGEPDGTMNFDTHRAIAMFQKDMRMRRTGVISHRLIDVLYAGFGEDTPPAGHLYVRRRQEDLFDTPVGLRDAGKLLGTHLLTLSGSPGETGPHRWISIAVDQPVMAEPAEVLRRFVIPDEVRRRIAAMLTPHSSIAIADTGLGTETGTGTDFIVLSRGW